MKTHTRRLAFQVDTGSSDVWAITDECQKVSLSGSAASESCWPVQAWDTEQSCCASDFCNRLTPGEHRVFQANDSSDANETVLITTSRCSSQRDDDFLGFYTDVEIDISHSSGGKKCYDNSCLLDSYAIGCTYGETASAFVNITNNRRLANISQAVLFARRHVNCLVGWQITALFHLRCFLIVVSAPTSKDVLESLTIWPIFRKAPRLELQVRDFSWFRWNPLSSENDCVVQSCAPGRFVHYLPCIQSIFFHVKSCSARVGMSFSPLASFTKPVLIDDYDYFILALQAPGEVGGVEPVMN